MSNTKKTTPVTTKFYKDEAGNWRWQIKKGRNIIDASTEGYINRKDCRENYYNSTKEKVRLFATLFVKSDHAAENMEEWKTEFINDKKNYYKFVI